MIKMVNFMHRVLPQSKKLIKLRKSYRPEIEAIKVDETS